MTNPNVSPCFSAKMNILRMLTFNELYFYRTGFLEKYGHIAAICCLILARIVVMSTTLTKSV